MVKGLIQKWLGITRLEKDITFILSYINTLCDINKVQTDCITELQQGYIQELESELAALKYKVSKSLTLEGDHQ